MEGNDAIKFAQSILFKSMLYAALNKSEAKFYEYGIDIFLLHFNLCWADKKCQRSNPGVKEFLWVGNFCCRELVTKDASNRLSWQRWDARLSYPRITGEK